MIQNSSPLVREHRVARSYRNDPYSCVVTSIDDYASELRPDLDSSRNFINSKKSYSTASCGNGERSFVLSPSVGSLNPPSLSAAPSAVSEMPKTVFPANTVLVLYFKYGMKLVSAPFPVEAGALLVVDGDRGYDGGHVLHPANAVHNRVRRLTVRRVASKRDREEAERRREKERRALIRLQELAKETEFTAEVIDVMFQLDGRKITIIVQRDSKVFVDFRRLQRAAFDFYRCRIWFSYLDEVNETMSTDITQPVHRRPLDEDS